LRRTRWRNEHCAILLPHCWVVGLQAWAKENKIQGEFQELCQKDQVKNMLLQEVTAMGKKKGLKVLLSWLL
jgi:hypothetical protein